MNKSCIFASMNERQESEKWKENVILVDADYADNVAFDLIVNFERIIGRHIPKADMARWLDCIALDGGLREGQHETQVVLIHDRRKERMDNFAPGHFETELNGKAFKDHLGEFTISAVPVEDMTTSEDLFAEAMALLRNAGEVKRIMAVPGEGKAYEKIRELLRHTGGNGEQQQVTVFTMEPAPGGNFVQEILGYSLMNALGIRAEEIK